MHLMLFILAQEDKINIRDVLEQCSDSYLAGFLVAYIGGFIFAVYATLRVMSQYKQVTLVRSSARFLLRNRLLTALEGQVGKNNILVQGLSSQVGYTESFMQLARSVMFTSVQVSTSYVSLLILGYVGTAIFSVGFCGYFWEHVVGRVVP